MKNEWHESRRGREWEHRNTMSSNKMFNFLMHRLWFVWSKREQNGNKKSRKTIRYQQRAVTELDGRDKIEENKNKKQKIYKNRNERNFDLLAFLFVVVISRVLSFPFFDTFVIFLSTFFPISFRLRCIPLLFLSKTKLIDCRIFVKSKSSSSSSE